MTVQRNEEDIQTFERGSGGYENSFSQHLIFEHIHCLILDAIPAGFEPCFILDIGCGTGQLLQVAARRWTHAPLLGVDPADGRVTQARCLIRGADFQVSQAETLPLPGNSVDLAFSI
jgi:ubiquinone/menaquinone biosynthesis C-methylase UbiE